FKLIQINKKYRFLESSKICIDLCAAPGGWSQVAAKSMQREGTVIALDILPIRNIRNCITHVADITTEKARSLVRKSMQGAKADVVMCDGAPNIGASYDKDSYEQNEIVLLSLRCATEHLIKGGTFVTKVYRSADYNALMWVIKQFFKSVEACKPASSRSQSAEIFLVCTGYVAPTHIDPKLLDPKTVFEAVTDVASNKPISVFDKDYTKHRRQRQGYDGDLDGTMRRLKAAAEFDEMDTEDEEDEVMREIEAVKEKKLRKIKRAKKKEREVKAKLRQKKLMGLDERVEYDEDVHSSVFSLKSIKTKRGLEKVGEVNLDDGVLEARDIDYDSEDEEEKKRQLAKEEDLGDDGSSDDEDNTNRLDDEMDLAYSRYLENTSNFNRAGTKMAKRSKKLARIKAQEEMDEDGERLSMGGDHRAYAKLLSEQGKKDSDDEDESSEDDGRWFSNDLFGDDEMGGGDEDEDDMEEADSDGSGDGSESDSSEAGEEKISASSVLASMPKTDKQKRHEARVKAKERMERRDERRRKQKGEGFDIVSGKATKGDGDGDEEEDAEDGLHDLDEKSKKRIKDARRLIAAGMGKTEKEGKNTMFQIAPAVATVDDRKYGSEDEDYDSDDHARTLAIGTMMLRKSSQKALVDSSYNRFAWNDPADLPDWFQDDEKRHYRPQLPVPEALVEKMKAKFIALTEKPIKKVAEARARKSKRANAALKAAKAAATAVAANSEMSESQKLKAISKAMKGKQVGAPSKSYVVAKKGKGKMQGGKGIKLVDKREKSDKRGMKRAKQKGKKGGLTGNKRRRNHS
ncbi:hypothetical protein TrRE_jg227, partial [Triparma retinervis]